jgi:hypothetical protein
MSIIAAKEIEPAGYDRFYHRTKPFDWQKRLQQRMIDK